MSALDASLLFASRFADTRNDTGELKDAKAIVSEARAELELLREAAFERAAYILKKDLGTCPSCAVHGHHVECRFRRILRTDPERARKMGLGWAL